jgi:plastocyanin
MKNIKFDPATLTVAVGQTVTWTDEESVPHDVVAKSGADFKSEVFGKGKSYTFTPTKAGTIEYVCTLHPGMTGTLIVTAKK